MKAPADSLDRYSLYSSDRFVSQSNDLSNDLEMKSISTQSKFTAISHQFVQGLLTLFAGNSEPRIRQLRDRSGNLYFRIYDPLTQQTYSFDSDAEVRVWLDRRYYQ